MILTVISDHFTRREEKDIFPTFDGVMKTIFSDYLNFVPDNQNYCYLAIATYYNPDGYRESVKRVLGGYELGCVEYLCEKRELICHRHGFALLAVRPWLFEPKLVFVGHKKSAESVSKYVLVFDTL